MPTKDKEAGQARLSCLRAQAALVVPPEGPRTIGVGSGIDPGDIVHSRYIVLWGINTIFTNLHCWPYARKAQRRRARVVVVLSTWAATNVRLAVDSRGT